MKRVLAHKKTLIAAAALLAMATYVVVQKSTEVPVRITTTVETGTVRELISVSGVLKAESEATLAFPVAGTVGDILVTEGDAVSEGQLLATLEQAELLAERETAYGDLLIAEANRQEAESGPRTEARVVTAAAVAMAKAELERTKTEEARKVENAYRTLLSTNLEATPTDPETDDIPPTVFGTYTCGREGAYSFTVFRSGAKSGYSYRLSGLESGTYSAYTDAASAFGSCGLSLQFAAGELYNADTWTIAIPNTKSPTYVTNLNAYELAKKQAANAIATAEETLTKVTAESLLTNAAPRSEEKSRLDAAVIQASARLTAVDARLKDRTLVAPFAGVVTAIEMTEGELAPADALTIVADARYELTVRIPEIDITHISLGQPAEILFDARADETITAKVDFISETATEIDGVAYFEAKIHFNEPPSWFRSGLNADVNIIVDAKESTARIPKRFLTKTETGADAVLVPISDKETRLETVTITFTGNDGFVAVEGITPGSTVVAP